MRSREHSNIPEAGTRWREIGRCQTEEISTTSLGRAKCDVGLDRLACLVLFLLLLNGSSCAQPQLIENSTLNEGRIYDTVSRVSYASGMKVSHPLSVKLTNRTKLHEILRESEAATRQSDLRAARQLGYTAMGFPSEGSDAFDPSLGLLAQSVAGVYLPRAQTLYVVNELARSEKGGIYLNSLGDLGDEITLAHEVVHALQHLHYPEVFELDEALWEQQTDAALALQAAIEGDATLWSAQSLGFLGRARDPEDVLTLSRDSKFDPLSEAPPLVRERFIFPYTYGYRFAYREGKNGLKSPPASTEQVIHIKKKGRSPFMAIDLSDFSRMLETRGCQVLFQDTMGELTLSLWARSLASSTDQRVWDGWDGDRWIAAKCEHSREVAWLTSWDSEQDAHEFESAVAEIAADWQRRADLTAPLVAERQGREVAVSSGGLRPEIDQLQRLAKRVRVTTRSELAAHFASTRVAIGRSTQGH